MRKILIAILALLPSLALAQVPTTLPPETVLGRMAIGAGPPQAIPFADLSAALGGGGGTGSGGVISSFAGQLAYYETTGAFVKGHPTLALPAGAGTLALSTGALTNGDCVTIVGGAFAAAGGPCTTGGGGGTVTLGSAGRLAYYPANTTSVGPTTIVLIPSAFTAAAIQTAINAVCAAGGGIVQLLDGVYVWPSGGVTVGIPCGNMALNGSANTILRAPADTSAINGLISITNPSAGATTVAVSVAKGANVATLTNATGYTAGKYIWINGLDAGATRTYSLVSRIISVAGNTVTFSDPMPFAITVGTDITNTRNLTPLENISISNIVFDGNGNTGLTRGLLLSNTARGTFRNLTFTRFHGGAALMMSIGFMNYVENVVLEDSGTGGESDFTAYYQTYLQGGAISSRYASGFGPQLIASSYSSVDSIHSTGATGRGVKLNGVLYGHFGTLLGNRSGSTGVAVTLASQYNQIDNVVALSNGAPSPGNAIGFWMSGDGNKFNQVGNLQAFGNFDYDLSMNLNDDNNSILSANYNTSFDGGINNTFPVNGGTPGSATFVQIARVRSGGGQPTVTACGTGFGIVGTDFSGTMATGTGAGSCVLTFAKPFAVPPRCTVSWRSNVAVMQYSISATALTISQTAGVSTIDYICTAASGG